MEVNKIYNENCLDTMAKMPDNFIDLTVTSPPYDNLRDYKGYSFLFEDIAKELYRVTKPGGVLVWVVGDETKNGSESGTSFRQALYFMECGFKLHDTMIWNKGSFTDVGSLKYRYPNVFEYMFVFSKGKPKHINLIKDRICKHGGKTFKGGTVILKNGKSKKQSKQIKTISYYSERHNIWNIPPDNKVAGHPAVFPTKIPYGHILTWTIENDLVYDCFMGSGTTAKAAIALNRKYLGSEISKEYCDVIQKRLQPMLHNLFS